MAIGIGTQLGSYEITALLGKGGMGEVYRARDSRLKRDVAIKMLPEEFSRDADRISRFQREAEVLASLSHANIAAIHDLYEENGSRFLIMELIEGETLAERIARGALPADEALNVAKQICEALEAAHEKGIIHRDLKPANVKVLPDGKVKVLDFGLAKAFETETGTANRSQSPTLSMAATNAGVILGTASYMSPEQARGRNADQRSDVFAFGCVLYEMLTGKQGFQGEEISDVLASVLKDQPDFALLPRNLNPRIQELLRRCLDKNARRRWQAIGDVRIEIENLLANPILEQSAVSISVPSCNRRERLVSILAAILLVAVIALAFPTITHFRESPPPEPPEMRTDVVTPSTGDPISFALSPDGRQLVFVASEDGASRLWLRPLGATGAQPLAGTEGATYPFWSPDSRSIGFFADSTLKRLDIGGGRPQAVAAWSTGRGAAWGANGVILLGSVSGPLFRLSASGGTPQQVTKLDKQTSHRFPQFLPDGNQFLFYAQGTPQTAGIYLGSLAAQEVKRLTAADTAGVYIPGGWLAWVRAGTLVAQRLDPGRKELTGDPVTIADPVSFDSTTSAAAVSPSSTGSVIAYRAGTAGGRRQLQWYNRSGKGLSALSAPDENGVTTPRISPDARRVAVSRTAQGNPDIWVLDGTRTNRFTFDPARELFPVWSSDGSRIIFDSNRKGVRNLYAKLSSGVGGEELLVESTLDKIAGDSSPDGRFLMYTGADPKTDYDLWVLPLDGDRKPWVFLKTNFSEKGGNFSPDGRWVTYMSNESGRSEIYVRPFVDPSASATNRERPGGQWQVSVSGGMTPRWAPDGKELYYIGPDSRMMAVPFKATATTFEPGAPVALFSTKIYGGGSDINVGRQYDVARDGRFLINSVLDEASSPITILQNWHPERSK
jgi:eukaryotic-like serine/threonine-protein kinase